MAYNPLDRSELELRFEKLFQSVFGCPVEDVLIPQYRVEGGNRQVYRIDYAYVTDTERIAIELDGHSKIKDAAESKEAFKKLLERQNELVHAGFTVYRLTWDDVVKQGGWRTRKRLLQLFKGKIKEQSIATEVPRVRQDEIPSISNGVFLIIVLIGCFLLVRLVMYIGEVNSRPSPMEVLQNPYFQVSEMDETAPSAGIIDVEKPVHTSISNRHAIPTSRIPFPEAHPPKPVRSKPSVQVKEIPKPQVPNNKEFPVQTASSPPTLTDEMVVFNQATLIYHQPQCYWAKQCTRNCIYIPKSEALRLGGRTAKTCNPH